MGATWRWAPVTLFKMVDLPLAAILMAGLALRLAIFVFTQGTGLEIVDEQHYHRLAENLYQGHGFAREQGAPTSIRPPLYPFFISFVWLIAGGESLQAVRFAQILLSILSAFLLYRLGAAVFDRRVALVATSLFCFYPSLVGFNYFLLSEVLFIFLIILFALGYVSLVSNPSLTMALLTGAVLAFAALTRSVAWPFIMPLSLLLFFAVRARLPRRAAVAVAVMLGFFVVVAPWAWRNTQLQGVPILIDTMGGLNLYMGNYQYTPLNRTWEVVSLTGEKSWAYQMRKANPESRRLSEGEKQRWAMRAAFEYMLEHPGQTLHRSLIKFADFWGLERAIIAGWQRGNYNPPSWFVLAGAGLITLSYMGIMMLGVTGAFLSPPVEWRHHAFLLLFILSVTAIHTLVFGHSRYHLPLIPFICLYAAAAPIKLNLRTMRSLWPLPLIPAAASVALIAIWARELLVEDAERVLELLESL